MEIDLNELNIKPEIDIDTKVKFEEENLKKAGILNMDEVNIKGKITENLDEYLLKLNINGKMILPCNLTLEPVDYPFNIEIEENLNEIAKNSKKTIDILPIIWENILMEIPMRVISPNAKNMKTKGNGWELITDSESKGNNSLAKLKDLL